MFWPIASEVILERVISTMQKPHIAVVTGSVAPSSPHFSAAMRADSCCLASFERLFANPGTQSSTMR